ncbi:M48 family metalloprotease [Wenyingzhuangia sp. IMCC45574]
MIKKTFFIFSLILGINTLLAQESKISFFKENEITVLEKKIKQNIKLKTKSFKGSDYAKEKKRTVKNITEYFSQALEDSIYVHNPYFEAKVLRVVENIYKANPELKNPNNIFLLNRSFTPNAACFGIHTYEFNLGLFALIENDDELAFIICHEMAHQYLKHLEKKIEDRNNTFNNDELERKVTALKKIDGPKSSKAIKILKNIATDLSDKSREFEIQADSLGLIYYQKTMYNPKAPNTLLQKLGTLEERLFSHKINWKQTFGIDYKGYVNTNTMFKKRVIDADFKIDKDSIRTHPHTKTRIQKLGLENQHIEIENKLNQEQIKAYSSLGEIHFSLVKPFYIYTLLHEKFPNENNHTNRLIELIDEIYKRKKNHTLGKYIPPFINNYSKEKIYNDIIHFLYESELQQLKNIQIYLKQKL